jgi:hypothetical protein
VKNVKRLPNGQFRLNKPMPGLRPYAGKLLNRALLKLAAHRPEDMNPPRELFRPVDEWMRDCESLPPQDKE